MPKDSKKKRQKMKVLIFLIKSQDNKTANNITQPKAPIGRDDQAESLKNKGMNSYNTGNKIKFLQIQTTVNQTL